MHASAKWTSMTLLAYVTMGVSGHPALVRDMTQCEMNSDVSAFEDDTKSIRIK